MIKWVIAEQIHGARPAGTDVPAAVYDILLRRGVEEDKLEDFLSPSPRATYDPFLLQDLKESAELILEYLNAGRKICVYGDYDADGVTSTALLMSVFAKFSKNIVYYIPSRFAEGYGLNFAAIDKLAADGVELIVTVDCGSTSPDEVDYAKSKGLEIIVTDHHTASGKAPNCLFVNPKRAGSEYPFKELSGCGVAFKLTQGMLRLCQERGDDRFTAADMNSNLDLVAISTVADVVKLTDENRSLVKYGLRYINARKRPGIRILLEALNLEDKEIRSENIAFILAPHINALGRMKSASLGAELLLSLAPEEDLRRLANAMVDNNIERKGVQEHTRKICMEALGRGGCGDLFPIIFADGAHEGVAGIVAGGLKEDMYKPVVIVTPTERGSLKGTGRSVPGLNIHDLLLSCSELFTKFGGHAGACGFSIDEENLDVLRDRMQKKMAEILDENPEILTQSLYIEKELEAGEKCLEFAEALSLLEPYGEGNEKPLFCLLNARVLSVRRMGADSQHMRFTVRTDDGVPVDCIVFRRAEDFEGIVIKGSRIDVAGELSINDFNGRHLQIVVSDIKRSEI